jgi:hypothetical protein
MLLVNGKTYKLLAAIFLLWVKKSKVSSRRWIFEAVSGLKINLNKSEWVLVGTG